MPKKESKKEPKKETGELKEVKTRVSEQTEGRIQEALETLAELGYETSKADLLRAIIEYRLSNAVYIYRESKRGS